MVFNALTFDLEEWYMAFEHISQDQWKDFPSRIEDECDLVLNILDKHGVKATFFVVGSIAKEHPELIRNISRSGHEIGIHSKNHQFIFTMTPEEFEEDLVSCIEILKPLSSSPVIGYRAPAWSITNETLWALPILKKHGILYDSSIYPIKTYLYGIADFKPTIQKFPDNLIEFPAPIYRVFGKNIPVGTGFFFRMTWYPLTRFFLQSINKTDNPFLVDIHPWDLDINQPVLKKLPFHLKRHYLLLRRTQPKLEKLLSDFHFTTMCDVLMKKGFMSQEKVYDE